MRTKQQTVCRLICSQNNDACTLHILLVGTRVCLIGGYLSEQNSTIVVYRHKTICRTKFVLGESKQQFHVDLTHFRDIGCECTEQEYLLGCNKQKKGPEQRAFKWKKVVH